jgi:hypothetical protein
MFMGGEKWILNIKLIEYKVVFTIMGWTCSHPPILIFPYMFVVIEFWWGYLHTTYHFISFPNPIICHTLLLIEIAFGYYNSLVRKNLVKQFQLEFLYCVANYNTSRSLL